ncbi:hypothetical protein CPB83DRAFT_806933 [Crepidotus variabilis]|uniref:Uncharacterized protein n=1 Tax=Crepidotus variabilis TaxID=179855 RepID=A0A9P6EML0_9AGAR|nr:hypothetical protein CPB83DRAFT_806933 [Crepidotus variabilis]
MNTPVDATVHTLGNTEASNDNIKEILSILERPLPLENLSNAKLLPIFPPDFQQRIDALCSQLSTSDTEDYSYRVRTGSSRPVTDVLDVILTSVLLLRASRHCLHGFAERKSNWVSMLSACGLAMSEAVVCSDDIGFARPRTRSNADVLNLRDFERKATIAISVVIPRTLRHYPNNDVPDSTVDEKSGSTSDASHDSYATIDLPFDAHITPARGKRVDCTLPVVFAARSQEMQELMTSLVCQRRVMGISTPVVGISLPEEGTYASLVLGWADASNHTIVHIAYPPSLPSIPASESLPIGVFDGSNPVSTLRLAQFILDLEPYFASVKVHALHPQVHDFCWRLDHAHFDHSHIWNSKSDKPPSSHNDTSRISAWQATLPFAETPDPDPSISIETSDPQEDALAAIPRPTCGTPSSPQALVTMASMAPTTRSRSRSNTRQSSTTNMTSPTDSLHPSRAEKSRPASMADTVSDKGESETGLSAAGSVKSDGASKFAKIFDPDDPRGLGQWLRERDTILLFLLPIQHPTSAVENQINTMLNFYEEVTTFVWFNHWLTLDDLPSCDPSLLYVREELFKAYQDYSGPKTLIDKKNPTSLTMETRLSGFCQIVVTAATSVAQSRHGPLTEAGTRGAWDQSIQLFLCDSTTAVADTYFVERTIPLPINRAVREKQTFQAQQLAKVTQRLCLLQSLSATDEQVPAALLPMTTQAVGQAAAFLNIATSHFTVGHYVKEAEREIEPYRARADGIYFLRYDLKNVVQGWSQTMGRSSPSLQPHTPDELESNTSGASNRSRGFVAAFKNAIRLGSKATNACAETSRLRALATLSKAKTKLRAPQTDESQAKDKTAPSQTNSQEEPEWEVIESEKPLDIPHIRCFVCREVTRALQKDRPLVVPDIPTSPPNAETIIPFVYVEYKRDGAQIHQAFNQIKMYCTSGLEHLSSIGITDFPVWGIVCAGNIGTILMAWKTTKSATATNTPKTAQKDYNFIFDRNVKRFNLSDPLQAFHFMTSVHRIHLQKKELFKKLDRRRLATHLNDTQRQAWKMPEPPKESKSPVSPITKASKP